MKGYLTKISMILIIMLSMGKCGLFAQHILNPASFDLQDVTLLESPFQRAQQKNYETLMQYDVQRLLTPYVRQSGLSKTTDGKSPYYQWEFEHPASASFAWNPALAMDGHFLGHYLSALSYAYASSHDIGQRNAFLERINYIVSVLKDCQNVFDNDKNGMKGFIGGIPDNSVWTSLLDADYRVYNQRGNWVPFYCEHKIMAGLRDAYVYAGNQDALEMFRKMCDWIIQVVSLFGLDVMEMQILQWETGAMNEVLADAYCLFDDVKYMKAAQKFSHQLIIENMLAKNLHEFLDKRHTNELTAMALGFARIGSLRREPRYQRSARNYWNEVISQRTMAIGGVGVGGYFVAPSKATSLITDADGPDLCTTCNLMRISTTMFANDHSARYSDYYEQAMLNHVLASMDPETGGFTYFTPLRPESYRIYSKVNEAMWCCVGSGLESQSRYGEFIYSLDDDTLFVNLFIPSELKSDKFVMQQETDFPYGERSRITIKKSGTYHLAVRHPSWATEEFSVKVNGKSVKIKDQRVVEPGLATYVYCGKSWKSGDVVEINYPMSLSLVPCRQNDDYIALRYGPTVLAAQTSSRNPADPRFEPLPREYGGDGVHDFSPRSREKFPSLACAPMLICPLADVPERVKMVNREKLEFEVDASATGSSWKTVQVRPFYDLHHTRYSIYWNRQSEDEWLRSPLFVEQLRKSELESLTLDELTPGEATSEAAHKLQISETGSRGTLNGHPFRDAQPNQWFEYTIDATRAADIIDGGQDVALSFMLSIADRGRSCLISIDGNDIENYEVPQVRTGTGRGKFYDEVIRVPADLLQGKKNIVLRMSSNSGSFVPRFYQIRLMKYDEALLREQPSVLQE